MTKREHLEIMKAMLQEITAQGENSRTIAQKKLYAITAKLLKKQKVKKITCKSK